MVLHLVPVRVFSIFMMFAILNSSVFPTDILQTGHFVGGRINNLWFLWWSWTERGAVEVSSCFFQKACIDIVFERGWTSHLWLLPNPPSRGGCPKYINFSKKLSQMTLGRIPNRLNKCQTNLQQLIRKHFENSLWLPLELPRSPQRPPTMTKTNFENVQIISKVANTYHNNCSKHVKHITAHV